MGYPAWVLTVGLNTVKAEFNTVFPKRDKASDGSIGDLAHQNESSSGHNPDLSGRAEYKDGDKLNEVRAIDVDSDLRDASGNKVTAEKVVQYLVQKARSGAYVPFRYIIFNKRIWMRSNGWKTQSYSGPSQHTEHIHFSGDYTQTADNWKGSLGLATLTKKPTPVPAKPKPKPPTGTALPKYNNGSRQNSASKNSIGTDVATLQRFIGEKQAGPADGHWDAKTTAGVKWYQREILGMTGKDVDGIAGPHTWAPILKALK